MQEDNNKFLGRGWAFPPTFHRSNNDFNGVDMVSDRNDIEQSFRILLSTSLGERIMRPNYGCNLSDFQFEPMTATIVGYIRDMVSSALIYHEPRIRVEEVNVSQPVGQGAFEGKLLIEVDYAIRTTNSRFNFVYDFYITEGIR